VTVVLDKLEPLRIEFQRISDSLPGNLERRKSALDYFLSVGFPSPRQERWRFTDVQELEETSYSTPTAKADLSPLRAMTEGPLRNCQLTFVDGRFVSELSHGALPEGVTICPLSQLREEDRQIVDAKLGEIASWDENSFVAWNSAFWSDGAFVRVGKGVVLEKPIHLLFLSSCRSEPFVTHPRILIYAEAGAQAKIVESFLGAAGTESLTNSVTEVYLDANATVDLYKLERESRQGFHMDSLQVHQDRSSRFESHVYSFGAGLSRNDLGVVLDGEGAECSLNGLYEATGDQHVDHHTTIDHAKPQTTSYELYKGILDGKSRGVFDGRVIVRPDAQKISSSQTNRNLILSDHALVRTKPELQISADDVKCKHGATIGQLDEDMLFYLRSRGIPYEEAKRLLIHAFACEIVDQAKVGAIRAQVGGCLPMMEGGL
jgi:Fe-S cluster assembly protein SufD